MTQNSTGSSPAKESLPQKTVIKRIPVNEDFLLGGRKFEYERYPVKKGLNFSIRKPEMLDDIWKEFGIKKSRNAIKNPAVRKKLIRLLEKYPGSAELNALNALRAYSDLQNSLPSERHLKLEAIVRTIGQSVNTYCYNFNTLTWFVLIYNQYISYLIELNKRTGFEFYNYSYNQAGTYLSLLLKCGIEAQQELELLRKQLKSVSFISTRLSSIELLQGLRECAHGHPEAEVGKKSIPAQTLLDIYVKMNHILARFPIFETTVKQNSEPLKSQMTNIFLQKVLIDTTRSLTMFDLMAVDENIGPRDLVGKLAVLLKITQAAIEKQRSGSVGFEKKHHYDPFIKFGEIVLRTTKYPIKNETLITYLKQAQNHLEAIEKITIDHNDRNRAKLCETRVGMELYRLTHGKEGTKPKDDKVDISQFVTDE